MWSTKPVQFQMLRLPVKFCNVIFHFTLSAIPVYSPSQYQASADEFCRRSQVSFFHLFFLSTTATFSFASLLSYCKVPDDSRSLQECLVNRLLTNLIASPKSSRWNHSSFHCFFKLLALDHLPRIRQLHCRAHLKISKVTKFQNDLLKTSSVKPPICTDVCMLGASLRLHQPYNRLQNFTSLQSYIFACFRCSAFKLGKFTYVKALLPALLICIPNCPCQEMKKVLKGLFIPAILLAARTTNLERVHLGPAILLTSWTSSLVNISLLLASFQKSFVQLASKSAKSNIQRKGTSLREESYLPKKKGFSSRQENPNERIMDSVCTRYMRATMEIIVPLSTHILVIFFSNNFI